MNKSTISNKSVLSDLDLSALCDESVLQLLDEPFDENPNLSKLRTDFKYSGFDSNMGTTWIYPTNYPVRQYQFNISRVSLFKNTLVVLPTGLGKTFIAAVVMYNIFRWYPNSKIIFMAPTRPLVAQQIEACYQIMGIPKDETIELTGKQNKKIRSIAWHTKRVFFVTPQVVWSDLNDPEINFPINDIKLVVVDEAHKAKGKYAYTEVIQSISTRNKMFRVLALSATPGRLIKDVVEVIQNLLISHIEVRWENSIDVAPYVFKKNIKTIVVPLGEFLSGVRDDLIKIIDPYLRNLTQQQAISGNASNLNKGWLLFDRNKFRESGMVNRSAEYSNVMSDFGVCISMYHALELLERHGIRVFLNYFDDSSTSADEKYFVMKDQNIKFFLNKLREKMEDDPIPNDDMSFYGNASIVRDDSRTIDFGHPKFDILMECLTQHFQENPDSKSIIFCEYRESVFLINRLLIQNYPIIKPRVFVGQGSSHTRTITQKEQLAIMNDFRNGVCNTLIATCVAEEGIDVGEVDLIVCFDVNNKNPIRFVQRIGRTGRKRQGKVIMLVSEGREQNILKEILATKDGTNQKIAKSNEVKSALYREAPRLVPPEFNPHCVETFIKIASNEKEVNETLANANGETSKEAKSSSKAKKVAKPKTKGRSVLTRAVKGVADVRTFFKPMEVDAEIMDVFDVPSELNRSHRSDLSAEAMNESSINEQISERQENEPVHVINSSNSIPFKSKLSQIINIYREIKSSDTQNDEQLDISTVIDSDIIPKPLKIMWLENNIDFVRNHYEQQNNSPYYKKLVNILGNKQNVINLLESSKTEWSDLPLNRQKTIHALLQQINADNDVNDESKILSTECPMEANLITCNDSQQNYFIDPDLDVPVFYENESKYASQRNTQPVASAIPEILSSTPKKSIAISVNKLKSPMDSPIKNSPLAKAFERVRRRNEESLKEIPHYLQYLGLTCIDDLFVDNDRDTSPPATNAKNEHKLNEKTNPTHSETVNETSDLFAEDSSIFNAIDLNNIKVPYNNVSIVSTARVKNETQYTVSQILRICDDEDHKETNTVPQTNESMSSSMTSSTRLKKLNVGSISDLFREDDLFESKSNTETISKSGSDCTIDYDVDDIIIASPPKNVANEENKQTSQLSNKENHNQIESYLPNISKQRSADLFSTFNETIESNVNRSNTFPCRETSKIDVMNLSKHLNDNNVSNTKDKSLNELNIASSSTKKSPSILNRTSSILSLTSNKSKSLWLHYDGESSIETTQKSVNNCTTKSPSILGTPAKKINLSRLRQNFNKELSASSLSSPFLTCENPINSTQKTNYLQIQDSAVAIVESNDQDVRSRLSVFQHSLRSENKSYNESTFHGNSLVETNHFDNESFNEVADKNEIFSTCKTYQPQKKAKYPKRVRKCAFIDDEAGVSGNESSDENMDDFLTQLPTDMTANIDDSDSDVDMHAKYLQSIRSPVGQQRFRIPPIGYRNEQARQNIFSQFDPPDDSTILEDSFVVNTENESEEEQEMCELEQAEMILKAKRKQKRKMKSLDTDIGAVKKRRRIVNMSSDSD